MLRPYFLRHRELLGRLCRAAYETVQELMASAAIGVDGFRTGMVASVHLCLRVALTVTARLTRAPAERDRCQDCRESKTPD